MSIQGSGVKHSYKKGNVGTQSSCISSLVHVSLLQLKILHFPGAVESESESYSLLGFVSLSCPFISCHFLSLSLTLNNLPWFHVEVCCEPLCVRHTYSCATVSYKADIVLAHCHGTRHWCFARCRLGTTVSAAKMKTKRLILE